MIEPGKCNALFLLWSYSFQQKYFTRPQIIDSEAGSSKIEFEEEPQSASGLKSCLRVRDVDDGFTIKFMDVWQNVYFDYEWNGHFGFNKYCHFCRDILGWICLAGIMFTFLLVIYIYTPTTNESVERGIVDEHKLVTMPTYPICDVVLRNNEYLTTMDLIYLTKTAYFANSTNEVSHQFALWFGDDFAEYWNVSTLSIHAKEPTFYHIYNKQYNFDLIVVRGTRGATDILQDISLWSEVSTFQLFSLLIPLTDLFPMSFIRYFVESASFSEHIIAPNVRQKYDTPVYEFIRDNIMTHGDDYVIVAGHSLGGMYTYAGAHSNRDFRVVCIR